MNKIIIFLIILFLGVGIYLFTSKTMTDTSGGVNSIGDSEPQPPALPE